MTRHTSIPFDRPSRWRRSVFARALSERNSAVGERRWLFMPYDQLTDEMGPLSRDPPESLGIVLIESPWKARRRPYHRQRLVLSISNLRHFALEQAERGVAVRHVVADGPYRAALAAIVDELGPIEVMEPAEWELRADLEPLIDVGAIHVLPHEGWISTTADFRASQPSRPYRMQRFYRTVRRRTGILMAGDEPQGGHWFMPPPRPSRPVSLPHDVPRFVPDAITREVAELVEARFSDHPGQIDLEQVPASQSDAEQLWAWAKRAYLPVVAHAAEALPSHDVASSDACLSRLVNISRLLPRRLIDEALELPIGLEHKEFFVRHLLGWREFVHHVHRETDGFRTEVEVVEQPGDAGYGRYRGMTWRSSRAWGLDGGANPREPSVRQRSPLGPEHGGIPPAFWGSPSNLACLDSVVSAVWAHGHVPHAARRWILANIATLLEVSPRQLADWFWVAFVDAYDWVVETDVMGLCGEALADVVEPVPHVKSGTHIDALGGFCGQCAFDPRRTCPISALYHAHLQRREPPARSPVEAPYGHASIARHRRALLIDYVRGALSRGEAVLPEIIEALMRAPAPSPTSDDRPDARA